MQCPAAVHHHGNKAAAWRTYAITDIGVVLYVGWAVWLMISPFAAVWEIVKAGATSGILGISGRFGYELTDGIGFEAQLTRGV